MFTGSSAFADDDPDRISNTPEIAMPPLPGREARGTGSALTLDHAGRARPFGAQAVHLRNPLLQEHRAAVGPHAALREACDLVGQLFGGGAAFAVGHDALAKADAMALLRRHLAPGEDDVERRAASHDAR